MVLAGQIAEVARYCETDVVNTYRVWLVYELFRGRSQRSNLLGARNKCGISSSLVAQIILTSAQQSVSKKMDANDLNSDHCLRLTRP